MLRQSAGRAGFVVLCWRLSDGIGAVINSLARAMLALQAAVASSP